MDPVFPPPKKREAPTAPASSPSPRVVHRPEPPRDPDAKPKLTQDEVRALLDVSAASAPPKRSWLRRFVLLPTGGALFVARGFIPSAALYALFGLWLVALAIEIRRFVVSGRRW
jgi:hypothetical protein